MHLSKLLAVTAVTLTLGAAPALAQQVDLDRWDFNSKPELVERLMDTKENLNDKLQEARNVNNFGLETELLQARQNIDRAINNIKQADAENWKYATGLVENDLGNYDYHDYGIWDTEYWL